MLAGDPGTVNQCLCVNHENPKLMLEALELDLDSKELMGKLVCSIDNVDCCISDCAECPEDDALYEYLMENIPDEQVTYSEWVFHTGGRNSTSKNYPAYHRVYS